MRRTLLLISLIGFGAVCLAMVFVALNADSQDTYMSGIDLKTRAFLAEFARCSRDNIAADQNGISVEFVAQRLGLTREQTEDVLKRISAENYGSGGIDGHLALHTRGGALELRCSPCAGRALPLP